MSKFIWCDLETSGLDPNADAILEVAVGVADAATPFALTEVQSWVIGHEVDVLRMKTVPKVTTMHSANGLWEECRRSETTLAEVEDVLVQLAVREDADLLHEWVLSYAGESSTEETCRICTVNRESAPAICERGARQNKTRVAGFSPRFDRDFLCAHMPKLREHLNHQTFDVTTLKTYAELMGMPRLDAAKEPVHRALDDMKQAFIHFNVVHRWLGQRSLFPVPKAKASP